MNVLLSSSAPKIFNTQGPTFWTSRGRTYVGRCVLFSPRYVRSFSIAHIVRFGFPTTFQIFTLASMNKFAFVSPPPSPSSLHECVVIMLVIRQCTVEFQS